MRITQNAFLITITAMLLLILGCGGHKISPCVLPVDPVTGVQIGTCETPPPPQYNIDTTGLPQPPPDLGTDPNPTISTPSPEPSPLLHL
jgi:hypothetical protein